MGFFPSRDNPDHWMKKSKNHAGCDHAATFVDDLIVVAAEPLQHLEILAKKFNLRNTTDKPVFFTWVKLDQF